MKILADGRPLTLRPEDYLSEGGEGVLFAVGDVAYKRFHDPSRVPTPARIAELQRIRSADVLAPTGLFTDVAGEPIGVTLPLLRGGEPLARAFTRAWCDRVGLSDADRRTLADALRDAVEAVHAAGCAVVDLHESNVLIRPDLRGIALIDVDSYQTPSYAAAAQLDAVRDRHRPAGPEADRFALALLIFQLFVGAHPYRGVHPQVSDLDGRMRQHLSAFSAEVRLPPTARPLSDIPHPWREWLEGVLSRGARARPPRSRTATVSPDRPVGDAWITSPRGRRISVRRIDRRLSLRAADGTAVPCDLACDDWCAFDDRIIVRVAQQLVELRWCELGGSVHVVPMPLGAVAGPATRLWPGLSVEAALGATYLSWFPRPGGRETRRVPELDGALVVSASAHRDVAELLVQVGDRYDRLSLDLTSPRHTARWTRDVDCT